ncbi:hypothetical protein [Nitrospira sp. M1]
MARVEEIQSAIDSLPPKEYTRLREWFANKDWEQWDQELEADTTGGRLDFLKNEAKIENAQGRLQDL